MTRIIILAAGRGTRMNSELPKVLVPLKGRPMIQYLMDEVKAAGVDERPILVVSPDNKELISAVLKEYAVDYIVQEEALGTGHAVACARAALDRDDRAIDNVVVLYGDHPFIKRDSIRKFAAINSGVLTVMLTSIPDFEGWHQNFYHWGRIIKGLDNTVEKIVEFKDASDEEKLVTEVNTGFMRFNKAWLFENIDKLTNENKSKEYYLTDMVKAAFDAHLPVSTMNIEIHEAMGINSLDELEIAEKLLA